MRTIEQYNKLISGKVREAESVGFTASEPIGSHLYNWQKRLVSWALKVGRCALFEECGLGKTVQQIEWAHHVAIHTGKPVLILCPLAVAQQTEDEGKRFGRDCYVVSGAPDVRTSGIAICNYDKLHLLDASVFGGVVLDESSILKAFTGKLRRQLTDTFRATRYKLCCSATPAPNDFTELGQHADFLNVCSPQQMLATYFINDTFDTGTWRLKKHSVETFWAWVATWAACVQKPSDIGGDDSGYDLPEVLMRFERVGSDIVSCIDSGMLIPDVNLSVSNMHAHNRTTMRARVDAAAAIVNADKEQWLVWCETNDESDALNAAIPDAVEVAGHHSQELKERRIKQFLSGESRVLVTKPSIAGWGLNFQHCRKDMYVGLSFSWEKFYQAGKRIHRFGQKRQVERVIVATDSEMEVFKVLQTKHKKHETMHKLVHATKAAIGEESRNVHLNTDIRSETGENWTAYHGDCVRVASNLKSESIGFSVFSPPFADLFTYSNDVQDMGNCSSMDEFMEQFGFLVSELFRITMPGRECAVHCVDLLSTKWKDGSIELKDFSTRIANAFRSAGWLFHSRITIWKSPVTEMQRTKAHGLLYKTLCGDSANSRVGVPDYLLVFRKPGENPVPIKHTESDLPLSLWQELASPVWMTVDQGRVLNGELAREQNDERHICPLQLDVIERALHLWSAKGDLVFSPFMGIGSEGYCAVKSGRRFVGSELKQSYFKLACDNLKKANELSRDLFS